MSAEVVGGVGGSRGGPGFDKEKHGFVSMKKWYASGSSMQKPGSLSIIDVRVGPGFDRLVVGVAGVDEEGPSVDVTSGCSG